MSGVRLLPSRSAVVRRACHLLRHSVVDLFVGVGLGVEDVDTEVEGEFGRLHIHIENVPSENPKTGKLTALSIIRSVQDVVDPVRIGT